MPAYSYGCKDCGTGFEIVKSMSMSDETEFCPDCKLELQRDYQADVPHSRSGRDYPVPLVSHSMAIHPDQIPGHKEMYPDVKVQGDGCLVFEDYKTHDTYMEKRGLVKAPQRRKRRMTKL